MTRKEKIDLPSMGYAPVPVMTLKPGDKVAFVTTMFGFHDGSDWSFATVERVEHDMLEGTVMVYHTGTPTPRDFTEAEETDIVWSKRE